MLKPIDDNAKRVEPETPNGASDAPVRTASVHRIEPARPEPSSDHGTAAHGDPIVDDPNLADGPQVDDPEPRPHKPYKPTREQKRRRRERSRMLREGRTDEVYASPSQLGRDTDPVPQRSTAATLSRAVLQLILVGMVLTGAFIAMQRMLDARPERTPRERAPTVYTIETVEAVPAANRPTLLLYGEVVADRSVDLRAPAAGDVVSVNPDLRAGVRVEAGDELVAIDDFDARSALSEAQSNLAQTLGTIAETEARIAAERAQIAAAEEQVTLARDDFERSEQLVARGTLPAAQLDQKRLALSQAEQAALTREANLSVQEAQLETQRSQIERLEFRVEQAERALADTVMVAPFSGIVRSADAVVGRDVTPNDVLASIYDDTRLDARFVLTDSQYGRLLIDNAPLIGRPVEVTWTVGGTPYSFDARIERVGAEIASERGGVEIFAALDLDEADVTLRPGAFVEVVVPDRTFENSFRLPEAALYDERDVYVNVDGVLARRGVERLAFDGEDVIVKPAGDMPLQAGERVMATRLSRVDSGLNVREPGQVIEPSATSRATGGELQEDEQDA